MNNTREGINSISENSEAEQQAEEPKIKLPTSVRSQKKQKSSRKTSTSALSTTPNPLTMLYKCSLVDNHDSPDYKAANPWEKINTSLWLYKKT